MEIPVQLRETDIAGDAHLYATRFDMMRALGSRVQNGTVAEVGVAFGDFTQHMLNVVKPKRFDAYDIFPWTETHVVWGRSCKEWFAGKTHREYYEDRFKAQIAADQVKVFAGDSSTMLRKAKVSYDLIYIDGDHSYEGVKRDAEAAVTRIADGGILIFNDYTMMDPLIKYEYGIVQVVNDLCVTHGWQIIGFAFQRTMFCDIALTKQPAA